MNSEGAGKGNRGLVRAGEVLKGILPDSMFEELIRPEDIGYTHPVFLQCFLPTRHSDKNRDCWQTNCGRMSLVVRAKELANLPNRTSSKNAPSLPVQKPVSWSVTSTITPA